MRIHALPEGKRLAQTNQDIEVALGRYGSVADTIFGQQEPVGLLLTAYPGDALIQTEDWKFEQTSDVPERWIEGLRAYENVESGTFYAASSEWRTGGADGIFSAIVRDEISTLVFFSLDRGIAFCPYEGGMDIVSPDTSQIQAIGERFSSWRP